MKKKANKKQKRWCQTWSYKVGGEKATKETSRIFHCYSMPQRTNFELPKYKRLEGIIDGGPRRPHYLPNTIIEWWENKRKSEKGDAKHGLVRWVEQKQQNKLVGFFYCYSISQMTNFELPKYRRHEGIIDGGGPRCSHYLPNTIIEWWQNKRKSKKGDANMVL